MDLTNYAKMVDGVSQNVEYSRAKVRAARSLCHVGLCDAASEWASVTRRLSLSARVRPHLFQEGALHKIKTTYDIAVLHMKFRYYMEHQYDPDQKCMVFHLDYSRRSDIDDSVGYWYVQPAGRTASRVYYSCECKLRGWVPGPVYNVLTKEALSKATTWVQKESVKEWRNQQQNDGFSRFMGNMRDGIDQLKLPPGPEPPRFVSRFMDARRDAAVRFVSNRRRESKLLLAGTMGSL